MSIGNLQNAGSTAIAVATAAIAVGANKICGISWNADASMTGAAAAIAAYQLTACSYVTPFRVGVHFDSDEALGVANTADDAIASIENAFSPAISTGEGQGYNGFWLAYWQNTC